MIPKVIHLIDITGIGDMNKASKFPKSLLKYANDFKIKVWTDENMPVEVKQNRYYRTAVKSKKYAFASDVARIWILMTEGGIYLDNDVELKNSFSDLLKYNFFAGYENRYSLSTACIGAIKKNPIISSIWKKRYSDQSNLSIKTFLKVPNVEYLSLAAENYGFKLNGKDAVINQMRLCNQSVLSPRYFYDKNRNVVNGKTIAIHWFAGSWSKNRNIRFKVIRFLIMCFGDYYFLVARQIHKITRKY